MNLTRKPPDGESVGVVELRTLDLELPPEGLKLEKGGVLPRVTVAYEACGTLNSERSNAIYICHALTGDAHVAGRHAEDSEPDGWWEPMIGPGRGIDTRHYRVLCANILGGCKGTTGPASIHPATGKPYGADFPDITVGDMVVVQRLFLRQLGIERLAAVIGGSFGGMQALEWAIRYPESIDRCICIASAAGLSSQALAFDIIGRQAILNDPAWRGGDYYETERKPHQGLSQARKLAHVTYLSQALMTAKFGRERRESDAPETPQAPSPSRRFLTNFQVESYLEHQGDKFIRRFDANAYLHITRAMDEYDLEERFGSLEEAFKTISARMLVVALSGDWLFLPEQSEAIVEALLRQGKNVSYCCLDAPHGHDAFLVHTEHLSGVIRAFLPWVGGKPKRLASAVSGESALDDVYAEVLKIVPDRARVLDLGCGDGRLLSLLTEQRDIRGEGIELDIDRVIATLDAGHDVLRVDIDRGLSILPDNTYDIAILSETLQVMRHPRLVLQEILRVASQAIVSFPNFGYWPLRLQLLCQGRMPKTRHLAFEWYETPNIHLFTLNDFLRLCEDEDIRIRSLRCFPGDAWPSKLLVRMGLRGLGADRVMALITRPPSPSTPNKDRADHGKMD